MALNTSTPRSQIADKRLSPINHLPSVIAIKEQYVIEPTNITLHDIIHTDTRYLAIQWAVVT